MDKTEAIQEEQKTEEKTFTQAELNAIIQKRVAEVAGKYENYEELKEKAQRLDKIEEDSKTELQKATERAESLTAELEALKAANAERDLKNKIAAETGVPASLLRGSSEADLRAQAEAIQGYAQAQRSGYPKVKDGGEVKAAVVTKEEILSIKDEKRRLQAIKDNIALFE